MALLEVNHLGIQFGGLKAVDNVSFNIQNNEILGLIGPNGAGKTTVFNLLTSVYQPTQGDIVLKGKSLVGNECWQTVNLGIVRTFQNIRLFKNLSAIDNIRIGFHNQGKYGTLPAIFRAPSFWKEEAKYTKRALELLEIFDLAEIANVKAHHLPYGQQRKLEICRALAASPQVLLLDEPAAGMNPTETHLLMEMILNVRDYFDLAIILIEHDMHLVMKICERLIVLDYGHIIAQGLPEAIQNNPKVIEAYLGSDISEGVQ